MSDVDMANVQSDPNQVQNIDLNNPAGPEQYQQPADMPPTMKGNQSMKSMNKMFLLLLGAVVLAGIGTGTGLQQLTNKNGNGYYHGQKIQQVAGTNIQKGQVFGTADESTFKDSAEGVLQAGGIDGEGSDKLLRPGGPSQTVYLTSSITDLSKFEGMKVKVWGETFKGQKAGWLMDVGRVQVEETQAQPPTQ